MVIISPLAFTVVSGFLLCCGATDENFTTGPVFDSDVSSLRSGAALDVPTHIKSQSLLVKFTEGDLATTGGKELFERENLFLRTGSCLGFYRNAPT